MSDTAQRHGLAGTPAACPPCGQACERCRFQAGLVCCVKPDFGNPATGSPAGLLNPLGVTCRRPLNTPR